MKPFVISIPSLAAGAIVFAVAGAQGATVFYYDNDAGAGFGSAGGTWGTTSVISTDSTGVAAAANTLTTTADTLNLGTSTLGLGNGAITVVGAGRSIGSIIMGSASTGIMTLQGGTITFAADGFVTNNATGQTLTIAGPIAGGATSITFTNANIINASNSYAGATIINGTHRTNSIANGGVNSTLGSSSSAASNLVFEDGAVYRYDGASGSTNRNFTINGSTATIYARSTAGNLTWNGTASFGTPDTAATLRLQSNVGGGIFNGVLTDNGTGQLSVEKTLSTSWTLGSANTFTGSTTVSGGILILGDANALQNSYIDTTLSVTGDATSGLRTSGSALNLGGLSGDKNLASIYTTSTGGYGSVTGITLNVAAANDLDYSGAIDGSRTLSKTGAGTQTLSGTSTYTGATTVSNGTLLINGSLTNSAVTSSATIGGTGLIGGNLDITAGTFHVVNLSDALSVNGTVTIYPGFGIDDLAGIDWNTVASDTPYTLIAGTLGGGVFGNLSNNSYLSAYDIGGGRVAYFKEGSLDLFVTAVPEPASLTMLSLGGIALATRRRRAVV